MDGGPIRAWRCGVCGFVHRGPEPPDPCPVCGAAAAVFEPMAEPAPRPTAYRCAVCGYVHRGPEPPDPCPVCGAGKEAFELLVEAPPRPAAAAPSRWRCLNCSHDHAGGSPPEACPVCGAHGDRFEPRAEEAPRPALRGSGPRVVIVGAGVAGVSAAESVRKAAPGTEVVLLSKDRGAPLFRLNLSRYLAGEVDQGALELHPSGWYDEQGIDLRRGTEVSALRLEDRKVVLRDGAELAMDKLVVTAGSHPFVPPIGGASREGVTTFRTVEDAERILEAVRAGARTVVVGGGILGLETAGAIAKRGGEVEILEGFGWLLPRQLNERAARLLEAAVATQGIGVRTAARVKELVGDERVRGVLLDDGTSIAADLVVVSAGVRPNSYLARVAGIEVGQGILVDDHLRSSHPDVLAAGDVAEHRGTLYGLWAPSMYQGNIAGLNAAGEDAEFGGIPRSNTLKVLDFDLFSIGVVEPSDASYVVHDELGDGTYGRFVFRDYRMVGAILVGDTAMASAVKSAVEDGEDFSSSLAAGYAAVVEALGANSRTGAHR